MFNSAITSLGRNPEFANAKCMVEVGPHSALAGPLKQIWKANKFSGLTYIPTWLRNTDSSQTLVETGGNLWVQNYSVNLEAVNAPVESVPRNYSKVFQTELRFSHEQRQIKYGRHDILGRLQATLVDGELVFSPDFLEQQDLAAGDVEVQVKAAEFELPQEGFPRAVTGHVLKVGPGVSSTLVGQEIITYAAGSYSTIIHIPNSLVVPVGSSAAEDLVASLPAISKVWNSMVTSAKATSGDFLLLLPTSLATTSLVAAFAQNIGIKIAVVVETKQQRDALASQKAAFEGLLLASERDAILDLLSSSRSESKPNLVLATGIESLFKQNPETLGKVFTSSVNILSQFSDVLLKTASKIAAKSIENAVITYSHETDTIKAHQSTSAVLRLDAKATYLMVGCLGGLGRSLTTRMMERGATSFAFISRSGADKPEAAQGDQGDQGCEREAPNSRCGARSHGLQDTLFEWMTYSKFMATVAPKVRGAESLHTALAETQLDFFLLDNFAWLRNLNGLPAVSLVLPMILDVGVVAENGDIETSLARKAMYGIDEREMLRGFEVAMLQPTPTPATAISGRAQIILGLEPAYLAAALSTDDAADAQLKSALAEGPDAAIQAIAMHIVQRCPRILMIAVEDSSVGGQADANYGLDSMIGAELRNWLFKESELDISFQHLLAPTVTFKKLATLSLGSWVVFSLKNQLERIFLLLCAMQKMVRIAVSKL
ncbi:lovastatin nonaketide synthase [Drepanopeziza brunnea f. sp. 'multigermtubi' MB_m1]|uniref:Lovastatin nonaketide synthase n=1 Tax=Marssonina brunnea f. sp. multigermtubi (strain MB_m1) TaxID=1072389 RepID=K1XYA4_MARBU|nr:lovastatin nonaketide synthase [Drepanopeziza brunnea f. sp. 'multigermtubi' MB_m1]EKD17799.1 lovastatin nonaketide synthase [Drepanopeziza brunnea f. sp. 'multigermtubi' MB_m1]